MLITSEKRQNWFVKYTIYQNLFYCDEYVYDIDSGDSFMGMYLQTHQVVHIKYIHLFASQLYLNQVV